MAQLFDIQKVTVGPRNFEAVVALAPSAPARTSDDIEATARVFDLLPGLVDHICLGDSSERFTDVAGDTELAHLLEHVAVELLAQTDIAGDISSGRTVELDDRLYRITLACPDDVLVAGALSSAVWILQWAFSGAPDPKPDVAATVSGLVALVESLGEKDEGASQPDLPVEKDEGPQAGEPAAEEPSVPEPAVAEQPSEPEPAPEPEPEEMGETVVMPAVVVPAPEPADVPEPAEELPEPAADPEPEQTEAPEPAEEPEPVKPADPWDSIDAPRPHLVR